MSSILISSLGTAGNSASSTSSQASFCIPSSSLWFTSEYPSVRVLQYFSIFSSSLSIISSFSLKYLFFLVLLLYQNIKNATSPMGGLWHSLMLRFTVCFNAASCTATRLNFSDGFHFTQHVFRQCLYCNTGTCRFACEVFSVYFIKSGEITHI